MSIDVTKIDRELQAIKDVIEGKCSDEEKQKYISEIDVLKNGYLIHKENMLILSVLEGLEHRIRMLSKKINKK